MITLQATIEAGQPLPSEWIMSRPHYTYQHYLIDQQYGQDVTWQDTCSADEIKKEIEKLRPYYPHCFKGNLSYLIPNQAYINRIHLRLTEIAAPDQYEYRDYAQTNLLHTKTADLRLLCSLTIIKNRIKYQGEGCQKILPHDVIHYLEKLASALNEAS